MVSSRRGDGVSEICPRLSSLGSSNETPAPCKKVRRFILSLRFAISTVIVSKPLKAVKKTRILGLRAFVYETIKNAF